MHDIVNAGEKTSVVQVKYCWSCKQLKIHCLEYFLFRVWLVVMSFEGQLACTP